MKVFIINLKQAEEKRQQMEQQLTSLGVKDYEFVEAIHGATLSKEEIAEKVYDYPECALTLGEIGCALSHIKVYQEMIKCQITSAIILEDDVILPQSFVKLSETLSSTLETSESKVITLGRANKLTLRKKFFTFDQYGEYTAVTAFGTYAYAINLAAAKSLASRLLPIKYEADMFIHFRENGWLNTFNVLYPQYIRIIDNHELYSDIYLERKKFKRKRHDYKKRNLLKERPIMARIKNRVRRLIWKIKQIQPKKQ